MNVGIFINNTNNEYKLKINIINFNNLVNNFNSIIIIDNDNIFSNNLKTEIYNSLKKSSNILSYILINDFNNKDDFNVNKILYVLNNKIPLKEFNYITFINDNYIYCNNLTYYFQYVNKHNLDFYSFNDSSEDEYHYQLFLFSIKTNVLKTFINYLSENINNSNIVYDIIKIFDKKIPYIKIAYLDTNFQLNIFNNNFLYKYLLKNNILPIISINRLEYLLLNYSYNYSSFSVAPKNFNLDIYREYEDLKNLSDDVLYNHFLNYGQYEHRKYSNSNNYINWNGSGASGQNMIRFDLKEIKFSAPARDVVGSITYNKSIQFYFTFVIYS